MSDPLRRLTGLTFDSFATDYWGVAPLLRRGAEVSDDTFDDLLSSDAVDELLSERGLRTPFVRMTMNGDIIPSARYTRGGGAGAEIADQVADDKVLAEFASGATLVLQGLHRMWPPLQAFARELAQQLGHPVQVNAYVTPPMERGLAPHYDVHDVFLLQFAGRKHWRVHEPVLTMPLRNQPWHHRKSAIAARSRDAPLIDTIVARGDMMYLPRGYVHAATSLDEVSGHLTIGVQPVTQHMLADQLFADLANDVALRRALPLGVDLSDETVIDGELTATIAVLRAALDRVDRRVVARNVGKHLAALTRPAALRPLRQFGAAAALEPATNVRLRPGLRLTYTSEGESLVVRLPDREIRFPNASADAIRTATSGAVVAADALSPLGVSDGIALISQLLRDGIVVPA